MDNNTVIWSIPLHYYSREITYGISCENGGSIAVRTAEKLTDITIRIEQEFENMFLVQFLARIFNYVKIASVYLVIHHIM